MEPQILSLKDYYAIYKRRRKQFFYPLAVLITVTLLVVLLLPPVYRSTATILIESQDIPSEMVASTVTSYANERLQIISQRAMTTSNLTRIIKKYNLYSDDKDTLTTEEIIETMRDDINLNTVSADVMDPRSGRPLNITIAFRLSYDNENAFDAQRVATELTSLYLKENIKERTKKATETSGFLDSEGNKLKNVIATLEKRLAEFKEKNTSKLPELIQLNFQMMDKTERDLMDVQRQIRSLNERRVLLQGDLAQINPYTNMISSTGERILGPYDRLKSLEAEFISKSGIYSAQHPDIVKMKREINSLRKDVKNSSNTSILNSKLRIAKGELAQARKTYSVNHPDIRRLKAIVTKLDSDIGNIKIAPSKSVSKPDNPAFIQIKAQLDAVTSELSSLKLMRVGLSKKVDLYESRIISTPQIEREYKSLTRDYENAVVKYQEIRAKQLQAGLAEELEKESKGERFTIIEPPQLPERPVKPNRLAFFLLGVILSFGAGIIIAAISEAIDSSIYGLKSVIKAVGNAPLVVIPYIEIPDETLKREASYKILSKKNLIYATVSAGVGLVILIIINNYYKPLDVLWYIAFRKIGF